MRDYREEEKEGGVSDRSEISSAKTNFSLSILYELIKKDLMLKGLIFVMYCVLCILVISLLELYYVFGSYTIPKYSDLKTISGTINIYNGPGKSPSSIITDNITGKAYIDVDSKIFYKGMESDYGTIVNAKINKNKIVEISKKGIVKKSYFDMLTYYNRVHKRVLILTRILLFILTIITIYIKWRLRWVK